MLRIAAEGSRRHPRRCLAIGPEGGWTDEERDARSESRVSRGFAWAADFADGNGGDCCVGFVDVRAGRVERQD